MNNDLLPHRLAETKRLAGHPNSVIAETLGVSTRSVARYRKRLGLPAWENRDESYLTHGPGGYNRGCRCAICVTAQQARDVAGSLSRYERGLPPSDERHGTVNGYRNWGCRCKPCKAANAKVSQLRRINTGDARPGT